jgi:FkbM family methyltransferase
METIRLGTEYGGWIIPSDILNENSVVYSAGAGEDISFDVELANKYFCRVYIFDPTPRAAMHYLNRINFYKIKNDNLLQYFSIGIAEDSVFRPFYLPKNKEYVSCSTVRQSDEYIMAYFTHLRNIMKTCGHRRIDLLKLDIEGAEYDVLKFIIKHKLDIQCICCEFHKDEKPELPGYIKIAIENNNITYYKL